MTGKFQIKSFKQLYFILFILSLIFSVGLFIFFKPYLRPFSLELIQKKFNNNTWHIIYHDFDHDGYSEGVEVGSDKNQAKYKLIFQAYQQDVNADEIIDQFDFSEALSPHRLFFNDFTGDGYDEAVVFSQDEDSLFLSVIDVDQRAWLLKRLPLLTVQKPNPFHKWDIKTVFCKFLDIDHDGREEIIFALHTGKALHPRGVFIFDLVKKTIIDSFKTNAGIGDLILFDLTGSGQKEIILAGRASGNINSGKYPDDINWLFILDQNLKPVFRPKNFSEFPGNTFLNPLKINGKSFLLITTSYQGPKELPNELHLINSEGLDIKSKQIQAKSINDVLVNNDIDPPQIVVNSVKGSIRTYNLNFTKLKENNFNFTSTNIYKYIDLDHDAEKEIILASNNGLYVIDKNLDIVASHKIMEKVIGYSSVRLNGAKNSDIAFHDVHHYNLLSYQKNQSYSLIPLMFLGAAAGIFLILIVLFYALRFFYIYLSYFLFSIKKSANGIIILNHKGRIFYLNSAVQIYLHLSSHLARGDAYNSCLKDRPEVLECISESIIKGQKETREISAAGTDYQFKGEVVVYPFKTSFGLVIAYLVEIRDYTGPVLTDRLKSWTHSIQKMAHDIKQPLSSISLNLKALQQRLEPVLLDNKPDLNDDLQMMKSELDRVRDMTNNFLKFVNLDQPIMQYSDISQLIKNCIPRYDVYINDKFSINLEINEDLPALSVDAQQLTMVIHTLIENAIDALKGNGLIQISVMLAQYLDKSFADYVQIEIADNGPGISEEIKDKLFEPFFTTKAEGTGMGLALAKKIIEDHQGFIDIHSNGKLGTVVRLAIPVLD